MPQRSLLLLASSILLPAVALGWLGLRIFDLQRAYFELKTAAAAAGLKVEGLPHGDLLFAYYATGALLVLLIGLFMRFLLWRDLRRYRQLAGTVSHELRTPLTTIQLYAETLALDRVADPARRKIYLETIARESRRLEHVVDNILRYVRSDWEPNPGQRRSVALHELAAATVDRLTPSLEHTGHHVHLTGTATTRVEADRGALEHALQNLLTNAMKYSPAHSTIAITIEETAGDALLRVADHGEGIPAQDRERIFEEFYRSAHTTADGIGLGLPLVRRIVKAHGGRVWAEANQPSGSVFTIRLPKERISA